jgi:hypothetical protein
MVTGSVSLAGPFVAAVCLSLVAPSAAGLGAVVSSAEGCEVVGVGLAGWSGVVVGLDVVEVAAPAGAGAVGEDAGGVAELDEVAHPGGWVVGVDRIGPVHPQDGLDGGAGVAEPGLDLLGGGGAEVLDLADSVGGVEVEVELGPRRSGEGGEGFGLADAEGVGVAVGLEVGAVAQIWV